MINTRTHRLGISLSALIVAGALASAQSQQSSPSLSPVKVQPPASAVSKASTPPPASSKPQSPAVGGKLTSVKPVDSPQDTDSFWVESIDIDGDGDVDSADLLWDDEDKVLFIADDGPFTCESGGKGAGELLVAIYGTGNARKQPAGSGWYVVSLDAGECGVKAAGLLGCRFDAKGSATECGAAVLQDDEVSIKPSK